MRVAMFTMAGLIWGPETASRGDGPEWLCGQMPAWLVCWPDAQTGSHWPDGPGSYPNPQALPGRLQSPILPLYLWYYELRTL